MVTSTPSALGAFLVARRAAVRPDAAAVLHTGRRMVDGLRREEVAVLAGVSADYYARLEQGRERHPSAHVLDALARALRLDVEAREHLHRLAGALPTEPASGASDVVSADLLQLMDHWPDAPAFVLGPTLDVLAANALADALFVGCARTDNLVRLTFLDPASRQLFADWPGAAAATVANLRLCSGRTPGDLRFATLVEEVSAASPDFRRLWSEHLVRGKAQDAKRFVHPEVGPLDLTSQAFDVRGAPGQQLVVYQALPGSPSADGLRLLGSLAATPRPAPRADDRRPPEL